MGVFTKIENQTQELNETMQGGDLQKIYYAAALLAMKSRKASKLYNMWTEERRDLAVEAFSTAVEMFPKCLVRTQIMIDRKAELLDLPLSPRPFAGAA